jgi:DNA repair protein RecN (Recombination protein N)
MLTSLAIRDVVLIDRLDLTFSAGLSALTGETGAGKSILLDALGLALGSRGDSALVRPGAAQATVIASFEPDPRHKVRALLSEQGVDADELLLLRRVLGADGRSRAFINDQPVSIGLLRRVGESLVEIHGQFDSQGLLDPASHRAALDAFGGLESQVADVETRHASWRDALVAEAAERDQAARARDDEEALRHAAAELDTLAPKIGEEAELAERRAFLGSREKLVEALNAALSDVAADKGVDGALRSAQRHLARFAPTAMGRLDAAMAALERAAVEASEAIGQIQLLGRSLDSDAGALEAAEERLFALRALARKHHVKVDELPELREEIARRLSALDDQGGRLGKLTAAAMAARAAYAARAAALSAARTEAAQKLDKAMMRELPPLKLEKATFRTRVETLDENDWGAAGMDRVAFEVATNPGAPPGPLAKIASGGELARFTLALKVVVARNGPPPTLIFDEVDSAIGGATAAAVGERLSILAQRLQVLVVTHSPQVAARAQHHWHVVKTSARGVTATGVEILDAPARREEIARMLAGAKITDAARAAADSLLADGAGKKPPAPKSTTRKRA